MGLHLFYSFQSFMIFWRNFMVLKKFLCALFLYKNNIFHACFVDSWWRFPHIDAPFLFSESVFLTFTRIFCWLKIESGRYWQWGGEREWIFSISVIKKIRPHKHKITQRFQQHSRHFKKYGNLISNLQKLINFVIQTMTSYFSFFFQEKLSNYLKIFWQTRENSAHHQNRTFQLISEIFPSEKLWIRKWFYLFPLVHFSGETKKKS